MSKTQPERPQGPADPASPPSLSCAAPSLSPGIRRHLGQSLRGHFADSLSAPASRHLEALIAQLGKPGR